MRRLEKVHANVGRKAGMHEQPERNADGRIDDEPPLTTSVGPPPEGEEGDAQPEKDVERRVGERVDARGQAQQGGATPRGQLDRDHDQHERQNLRAEPHQPRREVHRAAEHEERDRDSPRPDRPHALVRERRGDEPVEHGERGEASRGRVGS